MLAASASLSNLGRWAAEPAHGVHDRAKRTQNLLVPKLLDSHYAHSTQSTYCPDSYHAANPQQHNLRPTVAARQLRIGRKGHAPTRALTTQHATALVTTSTAHGEPHITMRITARTHAQSQRSPPCAIVAARTSHERVGPGAAANGRNLAALHRKTCDFGNARESSVGGP